MLSHRFVLPSLLITALAGCGSETPAPGKSKGARIVRFEANPTQINLGDEVLLSWETVGTNGVNIEPRIGLQTESGSATDLPLVTTVYVLTVPGGPKDLVAEVEVEVLGNNPRVSSFTATPRTIMQGESAMLSWATTDADEVEIDNGVGFQDAQGSLEVFPEVTTTYRLVARRGTQISQPSEVTVVVASGNQPFIRTFTASPMTIQQGEEVTLAWEAENSDRVTIDNGIGQQPVIGSVTARPGQSTTYTITAVGPGGQANASVTVTVIAAGDPEITRFEASPRTIAPGMQAELSWETENAEGVEIDNGIGAQAAKDSIFVNPSQTTTYTLTAFGNGTQVTAQTTVTVAAQNAPVITSFSASPAAILEGGSTTLDWTTQNVTSVDIDNGVGTGLPANGSVQVSPQTTTTYTLTAHGQNGSVMEVVTVTVNPAPPQVLSFTASPASINAGGQTTLSWDTDNATSITIDNGIGTQPAVGTVSVSPAQTTQYTLTAMGPGGMASAQVSVTVTQVGAPAVVSFTASPQQLTPGGQAALSWEVQNATGVTIDNNIGPQPTTGTVNVSPATDTTYTLTAVGPGGMTTAQVTITVISVVGDTCADAFQVTANGTYVGNSLTANDDYSASNACTGFSSSGPDVVYQVSLQAGDRLQASLAPANGQSWDTTIYLVTGCSDIAQSCVAGQDNGNPEEIDYTAASGGTFFLIVDGFAGQGGSYTLDINISAAPVPNDQCSGAIDVTAGGVFTGLTTNATADYSPIVSGTGGCTGYTANSKDVTYQVALQSGERLQAALDAAWDASLYLVENCANVPGTCVAGDDSGNPESVDFTAPASGTYFLIVDGYGTASGAFSLSVMISPPVVGGDTCQQPVMIRGGGGSFQSTTVGLQNDYDPPASCAGFSQAGPDQAYSVSLGAGDVVEVLAQYEATLDGSVYVVTDCSDLNTCVGGADDGIAGEDEYVRFVAQTTADHFVIVDSYTASESGQHDLTVAHYTGETCSDAPPVDLSGNAEWLTTQGKTNDYSPNSGGCTGFTASGPDRVYSVAVTAGDQVHVTVDPDNFDTSLYMVSNCADVSGSCVAGSDQNGTVVEEIAPVFNTSGTYYVVVDGFAGDDGIGSISAEVRRGDTCSDAYVVPPGGGTFQGTTAGYGAELGTSQGSGSCTNYTQNGADAVYQLSLDDGQTLDATLTTTWDATLYLVTSCASSGTTCVAGEDNGNPETITHTNNSGATQTYYLIVDSWQLSDASITREGNYTLDVSFQ